MGHMSSRSATKSESQNQDEWSGSRVKPSPKDKPPRYDSRRKHYEEKDPDLDKSKEKKDLSMKSHIAFEQAVCRLAMQFRGIDPDYSDVCMIRSSVGDVDITDPGVWPDIARAAFKHFDTKYRQARYVRVTPSADGRTFEQGLPLPNRRLDDSTWPVWSTKTRWRATDIGDEDYSNLIVAAKARIDTALMKKNRDAAFRKALDEAIHILDRGKYAGKVDAPTYLVLLNKLSNAGYDLSSDTYVPTEVNEQKKHEREPFDISQFYGGPYKSPIDPGVTKDEEWRKVWRQKGPFEYDRDEEYVKDFRQPEAG